MPQLPQPVVLDLLALAVGKTALKEQSAVTAQSLEVAPVRELKDISNLRA